MDEEDPQLTPEQEAMVWADAHYWSMTNLLRLDGSVRYLSVYDPQKDFNLICRCEGKTLTEAILKAKELVP